eukprot:CAMPEP_0197685424 /NCGR_PEP_ID=MMETSP1338-20131121/100915_1 /TAXON_ID=43686 ORGANISM="Pelagodinium beii, Strain RCC1491" /NCGR_SAMPLE_ID=MMETSP1338 /ASSEMBLY_ACC=CAM_ASM_000754 /LENGTH=109 /DNA_ID=CAMNT_0043267241 /DNA_START=41 /DNA_END=371 /DNA_ORIENTATION=+
MMIVRREVLQSPNGPGAVAPGGSLILWETVEDQDPPLEEKEKLSPMLALDADAAGCPDMAARTEGARPCSVKQRWYPHVRRRDQWPISGHCRPVQDLQLAPTRGWTMTD